MVRELPSILSLFRFAEKIQLLSAGSALFRKGDSGDRMFVLRTGALDILVNDAVVETVEPGGIVGEMALIEDEPRSATVVARVDSELIPVDRDGFEFLVQQHPFFALLVMRSMAHRLRRMNVLV